MAFAFGFSGEDVDDDDDGDAETHSSAIAPAVAREEACTKPVKQHSLDELISSLPRTISYSSVSVSSPQGREVHLPRRELFDVRLQLLSEAAADADAVVDQLETSDLRSGVYEGGFKTWECAIDLASLLLDRGPRKDLDELVRCGQVVELGAGTALPSMVLYRHALRNGIDRIGFSFADFNEEVLRLVTLPNMLLNWAAVSDLADLEGEIGAPSAEGPSQGELEVTPELVARFRAEHERIGMRLEFLSGAWSKELAELIPSPSPELGLLVLAAETIYSPESTRAFVEMLTLLLARVPMAKAMVAAKRMYFGVGGSVDGLKEACRDRGAVAYEVENHGVPGMDAGVGRALVEVQMF